MKPTVINPVENLIERGETITHNGMRFYKCDGVFCPGVTTILNHTKSSEAKEKIINWTRENKKTAHIPAQRGTKVHKYIEEFLTGSQPEIEDYSDYWNSIAPHIKDIDEVVLSEVFVCHPEIKYAGRLDCFGSYQFESNTIIDFKTSEKYKRFEWVEDYCLQLAAYAGAVKRTYGYNVDRGVLLIARPSTSAQVFTLTKTQLLKYWGMWLERVKTFYSQVDLDEINKELSGV